VGATASAFFDLRLWIGRSVELGQRDVGNEDMSLNPRAGSSWYRDDHGDRVEVTARYRVSNRTGDLQRRR